MATNDGLYASKGYVEKDGVKVLTSQKLSMKQDTNSDDVDTILDEAGGFAQGTVKYMVEVESPVPADGFEIDWFEVCRAGKIHQLRFVILNPNGGIATSKLLRGVFRNPSAGLGANSAATASVAFHGREVR